MEFILNRIAKRKTYTIGRLYLVPSSKFQVSSSSRSSKGQEFKSSSENREPLTMNRALGSAALPSKEPFCDTLEPTWRDYAHGGHKIKGCSAIPEGRYAVVITYSPKFNTWLLLLVGDQKFNKEWQGIRIHIHAGRSSSARSYPKGLENTSCDTEGCILVGQNLKKGMVLNSRIWLLRLKQRIVEAKDRGEPIWLTIQ